MKLKKYEYKYVTGEEALEILPNSTVEEFFNYMGKQGWRVISRNAGSFSGSQYWFEREL